VRRAKCNLVLIAWACGCLRALAADPTLVEPAQVIDVDGGKSLVSKPPVITAVAIVPGGVQIATAGDDHLVRLWSTSSGRIVQTLRAHNDWVRTLAFSPDGRQLASAGDDRQIIIWDVATGKKLRQLPHEQAIYSIAYNPRGNLLAAVGFEAVVRLYDLEGGAVRRLDGPGSDLRSIVFSPDGTRVATAGRSGLIRLWNLAAGDAPLDIAAGTGRIRTLAYLPAGDKLVSAGEGRAIAVWDAATGQAVYRFTCPSAKVLSMAVCGESLIATGGTDNVIRVWNWQTHTEVDRLRGHTGSVASLAYDAASGIVLSGSYDTTVRVWRLDAAGGSKDTARDSDADSAVR
jgi:WD40 repeat protein